MCFVALGPPQTRAYITYIALYSAVNGPERSLRFYVFYNESIHITATIGYSLFGS